MVLVTKAQDCNKDVGLLAVLHASLRYLRGKMILRPETQAVLVHIQLATKKTCSINGIPTCYSHIISGFFSTNFLCSRGSLKNSG